MTLPVGFELFDRDTEVVERERRCVQRGGVDPAGLQKSGGFDEVVADVVPAGNDRQLPRVKRA